MELEDTRHTASMRTSRSQSTHHQAGCNRKLQPADAKGAFQKSSGPVDRALLDRRNRMGAAPSRVFRQHGNLSEVPRRRSSRPIACACGPGSSLLARHRSPLDMLLARASIRTRIRSALGQELLRRGTKRSPRCDSQTFLSENSDLLFVIAHLHHVSVALDCAHVQQRSQARHRPTLHRQLDIQHRLRIILGLAISRNAP